MKRALRRSQLARMKARALRFGRHAKDANHLAVCSDACCGNRRRFEGAPARERRFACVAWDDA